MGFIIEFGMGGDEDRRYSTGLYGLYLHYIYIIVIYFRG